MAGDRMRQIRDDRGRVQELHRLAQRLTADFEQTYDGNTDMDRMLRISLANAVSELDLLLVLMDEEMLNLHTTNS